MRIEVFGVPGLPEVRPGDDLGMLVSERTTLCDGDVLVITSKAVSKAEGRQLRGLSREEAVTQETVRVVATRGDTRIVETQHGFVLAAAGVDASNTDPDTVVLLPEDSDASARRVRARVRELTGRVVGVVVSDTSGRPWRRGTVDIAVGAAGVEVLKDYRGRRDPYGNLLDVTVTATVDELAAAGDLVKGKLARLPVAVVRGLSGSVTEADGPGVRPVVRPPDEDLFRLGTQEALRERVPAPRTIRSFTAEPVDVHSIERAVEAAVTAAAPPGHTASLRFVMQRDMQVRQRLLDAMRAHRLISPLSEPATVDERVLREAPCLVIPCLVWNDATAPRPVCAREPALVTLGAAVQNLLIALSAEGLASAWNPLACPRVVQRELVLPPEWETMAIVAIGRTSDPPVPRPSVDVASLVVHR